MEPFDPSMFPHRVTPVPVATSTDVDAGLVETPAPLPTPLRCRIRFQATHPGWVGDRETGITQADVAFPSDPGLSKDDRLARVPDGLTLRATAPAKARDADGVLFVLPCEVVE